MVDEGDSSSQDILNGNLETGEEIEEVVVSIPCEGADEITLLIKLNFPEGASLNAAAPNQWKVEHHGESSDKFITVFFFFFFFFIFNDYIFFLFFSSLFSMTIFFSPRPRPGTANLPRYPSGGE